jgi:hypothetical protein
MKEIEIPKIKQKKLVIVHQITWVDYVFHGLKLLAISIKEYAQERYTRVFSKSKRGVRG